MIREKIESPGSVHQPMKRRALVPLLILLAVAVTALARRGAEEPDPPPLASSASR